jgi:hypothetical protein
MTLSAKKCVNCHKDVSNGKRMKDSSGRYWCVRCGEADQKKKAAVSGELCASCGNRFPSAKLTKMGASKICRGCVKRQNKGPGMLESLKGGGGGIDKGRLIKMLAILGLLAAGAIWRFSTLHSG